MNQEITGYKVFNSNWTCRNYKFKLGGKHEQTAKPILCSTGFHFCVNPSNCFNYYSFDPKNKVAMIRAYGDMVGSDSDKMATNKIEIIKEISWPELLVLVNTGFGNSGNSNSGYSNSGNMNSGDSNSGNRNSGNRNSGNRNSGNWNSGDRNSGDRNSGNSNSGYRNSGNWNSGNMNSGDMNSGNMNSGNWNSGDRNSGNSNSGNMNSGDSNSGDMNSGNMNSGDWNSKTPEYVYFFNSLRPMQEIRNIRESEGYKILNRFRISTYRVRTITGKLGDFKHLSFKSSFRIFWRSLTLLERQKILKIKYFNKKVFYDITGVNI